MDAIALYDGSCILTAVDESNDSISFVANAMNDYAGPDDSAVRIRIGDEEFVVSRSRLTMRSLQFATMFNLGKETNNNGLPMQEPPLELHNDIDEFRAFLWYIHTDPLAAEDFRQSPSTSNKCMHLLGIASVAHMYEALDVAVWAMNFALDILTSEGAPSLIDAPLAKRVLRVAARWGQGSEQLRCARDIVCHAMHPHVGDSLLSKDIVSVIDVVHHDHFVLAHAYYYVLQQGESKWKADPRLRWIDRRNILCGSYALTELARRNNSPLWNRRSTPWRSPPPLRYADLHGSDWRKWRPIVNDEIQSLRSELWSLFDSGPWNLDE